MIALLENEFVSKRGWIDKDEFLNMVAIAESTPGPIAINSATYIGYRMSGVFGSLSATVGVVIPSFVIIFAISLFFDAFLSLTLVAAAFKGIQVCVVYLILSAGIKMAKGVKKEPFELTVLILTVASMVALSVLSVKFSSIFYILISGVLGLALYAFRCMTRKEGEK